MKRYLVFGGDKYYPEGGWTDFKGDCDSLEEFVIPKDRFGCDCEWWQIVDSEQMAIIRQKEF